MTKHAHLSQKKNAIISAVFFVPAFLLALGYNLIPVENLKIVFIVSIALCVAALIFASRGFKKNLLSLRIFMLLISLASISILLYDVYQVLQQ